jgi:hypothetical protein
VDIALHRYPLLRRRKAHLTLCIDRGCAAENFVGPARYNSIPLMRDVSKLDKSLCFDHAAEHVYHP